MNPISSQDYDILIIGGGMVGAALACALGEERFRVAVVERHAPARDWPAEKIDVRVCALSRASQQMLENLGVWQRLQALRVSPYTNMEVWDAGGNGSIRFSAADLGEPDLGHIVENRIIQLGLWERLEAMDNVSLHCPASVMDLDLESPAPAIVLAGGGQRLSAQLIVGADGRDSKVREIAGIGTRGWDYDQHALVATVVSERPHRSTAWQRFMPDGPLALLPLNNGRCSIVWSTLPSRAAELLAMDEAAFCQLLTEASDGVLGAITAVEGRATFPLRLQHADHYVRHGLALVGDAAHAMHPLAGQGVNLGFLDAMVLVDVLVEARAHGRSLGSMATLRRYERARKGANLAMLAVMDGFKRLFSNDHVSLALLRNLGLSFTDTMGPIKHLIMHRALGLAGELPRLAHVAEPARAPTSHPPLTKGD